MPRHVGLVQGSSVQEGTGAGLPTVIWTHRPAQPCAEGRQWPWKLLVFGFEENDSLSLGSSFLPMIQPRDLGSAFSPSGKLALAKSLAMIPSEFQKLANAYGSEYVVELKGYARGGSGRAEEEEGAKTNRGNTKNNSPLSLRLLERLQHGCSDIKHYFFSSS